MKIVKIILIVILVIIVVAFLGIFIFLKTFNIDQYKPQIISAVKNAVGRDVELEDIDLEVSLKQGVNVKLTNFTIKDDPAFQTGAMLSVREAYAGINILSYLVSRQVSVSKIKISSPQVTVIRDAQGRLNVQTLAKPSTETATNSSASPAAGLPLIFIDQIVLEGGTVTLIDRSQAMENVFPIQDINLNVDRFSLTNPFTVKFYASLADGRNNLDLSSKMQLDLQNTAVKITEGTLTLELTQNLYEKLRSLAKSFSPSPIPLPEILNGDLSVTLQEVNVGAKGLNSVNMGMSIQQGSLVFKDAAPGISIDARQVNFLVNNLTLDAALKGGANFNLQAGLYAGQPNIIWEGQIDFDLSKQVFHLQNNRIETSLTSLPFEKIKSSIVPLQKAPLPELLTGQLETNIRDLSLSSKGLNSFILDTKWTDGAIRMNEVVPGISIDASKINFNLQNFSTSGTPFQVSFQGALFSNQPYLSMNGTGQFDLQKQQIALQDMIVSTDLALVPWTKIKSSVAPLKDVPLPEQLSGKLKTTVRKLSADPKGLGELLVDVQLNDGKVFMKDVPSGMIVDASQINFILKEFSLTNKPFEVDVSAAIFGEQPNMSVRGHVAMDPTTQEVRLDNLHVATDLSLISLEKMKTSIPSLKDVPLPEQLSGNWQTTLKTCIINPKEGLKALALDTELSNGAIKMKDPKSGAEIDFSKMYLNLTNFSLDGKPFDFVVKGNLFSEQPNVDLKGKGGFDLKTMGVTLQDTTFVTDLAELPLGQLKSSWPMLKDLPLPDDLKGKVTANIRALSAGTKGLEKLSLDAEINQGTVVMKDVVPGISIDASHIDFKAQNVSLNNQPFEVTLSAAVFGAEPNVNFKGGIQIDQLTQLIKIQKSQFSADLAKLSLEKIKASLAMLKDIPLPTEMAGHLDVSIDDVSASPAGIQSLSFTSLLKEGMVKLPQVALPIKDISADIQALNNALTVNSFSMALGEGTVKAAGTIEDFLKTQSFNFETDIKSIDIAKAIDQTKLPVKFEGVLDGQYKISGQGFDPKQLSITLNGNGNFELKDGLIKDINLLKTVLDQLSMFPNASAGLPEHYNEALTRKDTVLHKVEVLSNIVDGRIAVNPMTIASDGFIISAEGSAGLDASYSFRAFFKIAEDLSAIMVRNNPDMKWLLNAQNQIEIPGIIDSKNKIPFIPDIAYITKTAIQNRGKEELKNLLRDAIGVKQETPSDQQGTESSEESPQDIPGKIIDDVFGTIFK